MTTPTPEAAEPAATHPIPDSGGRWARDLKTGALTRLPEDEPEGEDAPARKAPAKVETPKPAAKADDPVKGA